MKQTLNSLKDRCILSNLQKNFVVLTNFFYTDKIFTVFLLNMRFDFDFNRHLSVIIAVFKNIKKFVCLEITDKYLRLSVILLFTFAV